MIHFLSTLLKSKTGISLLFVLFLFAACDRVFEYSPYEARVKKEHSNTTAQNLSKIEEIDQIDNDFKFAFVSDSHFHYTHLRSVIDDINKREDIAFVIFGGDMAHQGLLKEFELFYGIANKLNKPYLTVIGNHDYKSNGGVIYQKMFGDYNYSFEFNQNKFILFDDVVWESNKEPDFDWLSKQLENRDDFNQVFVIAHIPPFLGQFDNEMEDTYRLLMAENNVSMSIHGHIHSYSYEETYDDKVQYLTTPNLKSEPAYCIIDVADTSFDVELITL